MSISLYDISVCNYLQVLTSVTGILKKGEAFCDEQNLELHDLNEARVHPDMLPLRFQLYSVVHHSQGALEGIRQGEFNPPPPTDNMSYSDLQQSIENAATELQSFSRESIDELYGKAMKFKMNDFELPFTAENFVLSFSLPNLYFHTTTAYNILRSKGVPLGKVDYLGRMRVS